METETYWLWYGGRSLGAVRMPKGTPNAQVILKAIDDENTFPIGALACETPAEYRQKLAHASVKVYND